MKQIKNQDELVSFDKKELSYIFSIYGRMVALGEWRDYAISVLRDNSVFSIYRHTSEYPIYRLKKSPKNKSRDEIFSIIEMNGKILKRSNDLSLVLKPLEIKLIRRIK